MKQVQNKFGRILDRVADKVVPQKKAAAWCRNVSCYMAGGQRYCLQLCCSWRGCSTKTVRA